ncbi:uncharacterized protein KLLA0_A07777g [Kluyveromyces lactis]|uniref:KLLA0A07777p n=1 Tax=Kluyveromyces lactis (strain ATCC 8585 / CBS 2359 / DSM 70799 / NBRC 1267 / NRRL Y-1140 / WM37) TaxID=284590 RepID=Q6CXJ3_KLULA|nr:uncharacterized protein KLLA0_A07777g [Kluyveromyces lactis]CAH02934.1 KLLA0A07777p [Kluyveromyces lactis]|eukprot:XP_451346.1 uncharacterized protein KLLA0_A07777g [Kluyveromyces lactis]
MTVPENVLTTHQRVIQSCVLYNIVPRSIARAWEPQHLLWKGKLIVDELLHLDGSNQSTMMQPSLYRFRFVSDKEDGVDKEDINSDERLFCETQVISNLKELHTVLQRREKWYQIAMLCEGQHRHQIALELQIKDAYQMQLFEDIILRIRDEYEIFQEMYDGY